ncbi:hypothetical protein Landi51_13907 [Colletotrichum acutatum]
MCSLKSLATKIVIQVIDSIDDTPSVSRLSRTSRHLHFVANPILYRRAIADPTALAWAVSHDRSDVVHGILGHQADPHRFAASFEQRGAWQAWQAWPSAIPEETWVP